MDVGGGGAVIVVASDTIGDAVVVDGPVVATGDVGLSVSC